MGSLLARTIPLGFGAAVSPVLLVFVVLLLSSPDRPRVRAAAFTAGATAVLVAIAVIILSAVQHAAPGAKSTGTRGAAIDFTLGLLLAAFGVGKLIEYLRARAHLAAVPASGGEIDAPPPKHARGGTAGAAVAGVALMATNITTLALYVAALKDVAIDRVSVGDRIVTTVILTVLALLPVLVPLGIAVAAPRASDRVLGAVNRFVTRYRDLIMAAFFGGFGVYLVVRAMHHF
jgi:hypothetical protein